jgi:hypothetical protein
MITLKRLDIARSSSAFIYAVSATEEIGVIEIPRGGETISQDESIVHVIRLA